MPKYVRPRKLWAGHVACCMCLIMSCAKDARRDTDPDNLGDAEPDGAIGPHVGDGSRPPPTADVGTAHRDPDTAIDAVFNPDVWAADAALDARRVAPIADARTVAPIADARTVAPIADARTVAPIADARTVAPIADARTVAPIADARTVAPIADARTVTPIADAAIDAGRVPPEPFNHRVTFVIRNVGDVPAYINGTSSVFVPTAALVVRRAGEIIQRYDRCNTDCETCIPLECEAPTPAVRRVPPGGTVTVFWEANEYSSDQCAPDPPNGIAMADCYHEHRVPHGEYDVEVCAHAQWASEIDEPEQNPDFSYFISPAHLAGPAHCTQAAFRVADRADPVEIAIAVPADETFAFGQCGRAWTVDTPGRRIGFFRPPYATREGRSAAIPLQIVPPLVGENGGCHVFSAMGSNLQAQERRIVLTGNIMRTQGAACPRPAPVYSAVFPDLAAGEYSVAYEHMMAVEPDETTLTVEPCPECRLCAENGVAVGDPCTGDCECRHERAFCSAEGLCTVECNEDSDCSAGMVCNRAEDPPVLDHCVPVDRDACRRDSQCFPWEQCVTDPDDDSVRRCQGVANTQDLNQPCGCDLECGPGQACMNFTFNFTAGACRIPCADNRDCPTQYACLLQSASGLRGVCLLE